MHSTNSSRRRLLAAAALAAMGLGLHGAAAHALTSAQCAALTTLSVPATTITGAAIVPAAGTLPESCRVSGHVDTEINFELRLPSSWNGKFYHQGGGGNGREVHVRYSRWLHRRLGRAGAAGKGQQRPVHDVRYADSTHTTQVH